MAPHHHLLHRADHRCRGAGLPGQAGRRRARDPFRSRGWPRSPSRRTAPNGPCSLQVKGDHRGCAGQVAPRETGAGPVPGGAGFRQGGAQRIKRSGRAQLRGGRRAQRQHALGAGRPRGAPVHHHQFHRHRTHHCRRQGHRAVPGGRSSRELSAQPQFLVSNLEEVKMSLIAAAMQNSRVRAGEFAKNGDVEVGPMRSASQGAFYILPAGRRTGCQRLGRHLRQDHGRQDCARGGHRRLPHRALTSAVAGAPARRFAPIGRWFARGECLADILGAARAIAAILVVPIGTAAFFRMRAGAQRQEWRFARQETGIPAQRRGGTTRVVQYHAYRMPFRGGLPHRKSLRLPSISAYPCGSATVTNNPRRS